MIQVPISYITPNPYNIEHIEALIFKMMYATEHSGQLFYGWVSDSATENGIIQETGIIQYSPIAHLPANVYDVAELQAVIKMMLLVGQADYLSESVEVGDAVLATITTEFQSRGDTGVIVQDEGNAYWPITFPVRWNRTNKISYSDLKGVIKLVDPSK